VNSKGDFQQGVVECNLGDLPLILVGFLKAETTFLSHLPIIPTHFRHPQGLGVFCYFLWVSIKSCLSWWAVCLFQTHHAKSSHHIAYPWLQFDIWLWEKLKSNAILNQCFYEWIILVKLCIVMVLGNVKDKHTFSNLAFVKSKIQDCLTIHLDLVVWMYVQNFYSLEPFPFYITICEWNES